jgi:hypothetical protein
MWPVSDKFVDAVQNGATWIVKGQVQALGQIVAGGEDIPISGGQLTCDTTAKVERYCTVEIAPEDPKWIPKLSNDLLFPVGRELFIQAGFQFTDGTQELIPQGIFRVTKPTTSDNGVITLSTQAYDRSRAVSRDRFTKPYVVPLGEAYPDAIRTIIERTFPWFDDSMFLFVDSEFATVKLIFDQEADPWEKCQNMADAMGARIFFDGLGRCVLQDITDPSSADAVWTYAKGLDATLTEMKSDLDDERGYNGVVVTGENSQTNKPPVRAEAWDTDPASPTYYDPLHPEDSLYGPVPYFITSQFVTTVAQAQKAADANLLTVSGILQSVDFSGIPNPAHEGADIIQLTNNDLGVDQVNVLDSFNFPFALGGTMHGSARERRVLS